MLKGIFMNFITQFISNFKRNLKSLFCIIKNSAPRHPYKVVSIEKDDCDNYHVLIQITNKSQTFRMYPEEILENDGLVDFFSQKDIRTLTYLGYIGINTPKYKIIAKRLSECDNKLVFALLEKGKTKPVIKSANEISTNEALLSGLHQIDAHMIGYAVATEQVIDEHKQKQQLLIDSKHDTI